MHLVQLMDWRGAQPQHVHHICTKCNGSSIEPGVPVAILQRYDTANVFTITDLFGGPGIGLESRSLARVCVFACVN